MRDGLRPRLPVTGGSAPAAKLAELPPNVVGVWEAARDEDMAVLARATQDGTREPSFHAVVITGAGDTLGLQIVGDDLPAGDPDTILYVGGRGTFELVRVERWPALPGQKRPRVLLKLKAWASDVARGRHPQ